MNMKGEIFNRAKSEEDVVTTILCSTIRNYIIRGTLSKKKGKDYLILTVSISPSPPSIRTYSFNFLFGLRFALIKISLACFIASI